jgi:hypothetical protein
VGCVRAELRALAICRTLELARAVFEVAVEEKPSGRFMIRSRIRR